MPRERECDYCGADIEPGTGTMFVSRTGATTHFCSSKCEKNADLGREARDVAWTEAGRPEREETTETEPTGTTADTASVDDAETVEEADDAETVEETDEETEAEA